jgi:colanic acid/amylovoran biosynthesis protein
MKVTVIGSALAGNKGAAAMLESGIQELTTRAPESRFTLLSVYPSEDRRQNEYPQLEVLDARPLRLGLIINGAALLYRLLPPLRSLLRARVPELRALVDSDVLLDQGGITFVDGRGKFLIYNVATVLPALLTGTPVVKCAQAMGPFRNRVNRLAARVLLPRMAVIVSRGAITHEHLTALGLRNVVAGADLAFSLEVTSEEGKQADAAVDPAFFDGGTVVGISPSAVLRKQSDAVGGDYVGELRRMVDHVTQDLGLRVLLVPHSAREGTEKSHNNDLPLCREIYSGLAQPEMCRLIDHELGSQPLRALIGRCDLFIASRFHAMVSALAMGVPTLVIGWSHKYREVLDMFGLAEWALSHKEYTDEEFRARFAHLSGEADKIRATIEAALPGVVARSRAQVDLVVEVARGSDTVAQN